VPIDRTSATRRLPLLPYERELIAALGCSEDEYRRFIAEAQRRALVRPAAYDEIPDIQCELAIAIISLVVGLASTAASFLLAPKPRQPEATGRRVTSQQLANVTGLNRFSATSGFDSFADLANYNDPIPLIFGRYTGESGGILAAPRLVWSRAFSYGSQQGVKLLFVVGEQGLGDGLDRPERHGLFLGNTPLGSAPDHNFAFYWKRNTNSFKRVRAINLAHGTRGTLSSGDPQTPDDIFLCTTASGLGQPGFCHVYTPSANTQFGAYSAVHNGTDYRVNWRLVPIPHIPDRPFNEHDPNDQKLLERVKIAGDSGFLLTSDQANVQIRGLGQSGVGRGYGRRMGITALNGVPTQVPTTQVQQVNINDIATFTIAPGELAENFYYTANTTATQVADINSEITAGRRAADDMLQIGETIMIGRTVWVVESKSIPTWQEDQLQSIQLRCVEIFGTGSASAIGTISERMVLRGVYSDDLGTTDIREGLGMHAGCGFYPLLRVAFGIVRNTRECEVTEIGIRSQVWNRANNLCNFSGLPTVSAFRNAEINGVGIESGTMTLYMKRTSAWTIWLRPSGTDSSGNEYTWTPLGEQFCVTGETPQDKFNFIRITHPQKGRYEFKLVPKNGADITQNSADDAVFWRLNTNTRQSLAGEYSTPYGTFKLYSIGELVKKKEITFNPEMLANAVFNQGSSETLIPNAIEVESYLPDLEGAGSKAATLGFFDWLPDDIEEGRRGATHWELFGQPLYQGYELTADRTVNLGDGRSITVRFHGIVDDQYPVDHPHFASWKQWSFSDITVVASSGGFNTSQVFNVSVPISNNNPRAKPYEITSAGVRLVVLSTIDETGWKSPTGRSSAWAYELLGNAQAYSLGHRQTASFTVPSSSGALATIVASGVVTARSASSLSNFPGQTQAWDITYSIDPNATYGQWQNGALMENNAYVSNGNPFYEPGQPVGVVLRVLSLQTSIVPAGFVAERAFEENSQINDVSFYNSLLTKSNESGPEHEIVYVNESLDNEIIAEYNNMTLAGLALKASRNFTSLNQLRVWLADGIPVTKLSENNNIGPSNLLTDLIYYLLTDKTAGVGSIVSPELVDTAALVQTAKFLNSYKLYFDGAIDQPTNVRQFISDLSAFFLCNFVIKNGQFSIVPAVPVTSTGAINTGPVAIKQLFTSGNIIEGSFSVEYLSAEERANFQAVVRYRAEKRNQLPEEQTLTVRWTDLPEAQSIEVFDMTQFCTSRSHAFMVAKYFLSIRRRLTHTVKFQTTPYGMDLAPGEYIRVITEANVYSAANNGVVAADGTVTAVSELPDGRYTVFYWNSNFDDPTTDQMTVSNGKALESKFFSSIFTVESPTVSSNIYMIEQLTLTEDGLVDIVAAHFPATSTFNSRIALDITTDTLFATEG
jgi:hypothetical protein